MEFVDKLHVTLDLVNLAPPGFYQSGRTIGHTVGQVFQLDSKAVLRGELRNLRFGTAM